MLLALDKHVLKTLLIALALITLPPSIVANAASVYSDDASNYTDSYAGKNAGMGFGPFIVVAENGKPPYSGTFLASAGGTEKNQGNPSPSSINTNGHAFGFYANGGATASVMVERAFKNRMQTTGDSFSINFVTGLNDSGVVGITLYTDNGNVGTFSFAAGSGYKFGGKQAAAVFRPGALHLQWKIISPGHLAFTCSGALSYSGLGAFSGSIVGFKVYSTNSGQGGSDHDGYFNSMSETVQP